MFFACTILVAVALIGTAFMVSTLQTTIVSTQDTNKVSYLKALADHIVTNPGSPADWGTSSSLPTDFGLAASGSALSYDLDIDKVSRLNSLNNNTLSYWDLLNSSKLTNIALGITVSQILNLTVEQTSNFTVGNQVTCTFNISSTINSKPTSTNLHCYLTAENYLDAVNATTSSSGSGSFAVQVPTASADNALLIVFARASFDDRLTSYAIYNFATSAQQTTLTEGVLALSPQNDVLSFSNSTGLSNAAGYALSYGCQQNLVFTQGATNCSIPEIVDASPIVVVMGGTASGSYLQEWTAYPQIPLQVGSTFDGSAQNLYSYIVTVNGVLYRLDVSLGDLPK